MKLEQVQKVLEILIKRLSSMLDDARYVGYEDYLEDIAREIVEKLDV